MQTRLWLHSPIRSQWPNGSIVAARRSPTAVHHRSGRLWRRAICDHLRPLRRPGEETSSSAAAHHDRLVQRLHDTELPSPTKGRGLSSQGDLQEQLVMSCELVADHKKHIHDKIMRHPAGNTATPDTLLRSGFHRGWCKSWRPRADRGWRTWRNIRPTTCPPRSGACRRFFGQLGEKITPPCQRDDKRRRGSRRRCCRGRGRNASSYPL